MSKVNSNMTADRKAGAAVTDRMKVYSETLNYWLEVTEGCLENTKSQCPEVKKEREKAALLRMLAGSNMEPDDFRDQIYETAPSLADKFEDMFDALDILFGVCSGKSHVRPGKAVSE